MLCILRMDSFSAVFRSRALHFNFESGSYNSSVIHTSNTRTILLVSAAVIALFTWLHKLLVILSLKGQKVFSFQHFQKRWTVISKSLKASFCKCLLYTIDLSIKLCTINFTPKRLYRIRRFIFCLCAVETASVKRFKINLTKQIELCIGLVWNVGLTF